MLLDLDFKCPFLDISEKVQICVRFRELTYKKEFFGLYFRPNSWPTSSLVAYVICVCIFAINIAGFYLINFNATKLKNWQKLGIFIPAVVATGQNEK